MSQVLFTLVLALTAGIIRVLTGRNRRQLEKVPKGMMILCQPPGKRYVLYALGVLVVAVVLFFGTLYLMDGAPKEARPMWLLCVVVALLTLAVTIVGGNLMAKDCVYFGNETLQINRAFREPQIFRWRDIRMVRGRFQREITLYTFDDTKILTAGATMVNYEVFCAVLRAKCPAACFEP